MSMISTFCTLSITEPKLQEFKEKNRNDPALRDLTTTVQDGWPQCESEVLPGARGYWNYRDEVTYHQGIIFKGGQVCM